MSTQNTNKKIKVLEIEPVSDLGGVTQFISRIAQYLSKEEFEVHFAASGNGKAFSLLEETGSVSHHVEINYSLWDMSSKIAGLRTLIQQQEIDIVHAHTVKAGLLAIYAVRGTDTKVVFTAHGWRFLQIVNPIKKGILFLIEKYIAKNANAITYLTHTEYNLGKQLAPNNSAQYVIPLSLDINEYQEKSVLSFRDIYKIDAHAFVVIMVGRMVYQKDPETFFKVAELVSRSIPNAKFVWIGEGDKKSSTVLTTGHVSHEVVIAALQESNLLLFTSRFEGLPIAILEAMAARLPVAAAKVSGVPDVIVDENTGLLFEKGNVTQAAQKVIELYNDTAKRQAYATQAFEVIKQRFSPVEKSSEAFAEVYKKVYETNS